MVELDDREYPLTREQHLDVKTVETILYILSRTPQIKMLLCSRHIFELLCATQNGIMVDAKSGEYKYRGVPLHVLIDGEPHSFYVVTDVEKYTVS